ncbi:uncharacterized protein NPIL_655151 [Nephila pilipes]|uniref:Uncharacterized protein n=1 Tax=Nephila pilipes TaxID=299642 RepID=A0A8X6MIC3_NEPPI|nr:uncharacterized protein NPIL_655151 [Nephila pilipes]
MLFSWFRLCVEGLQKWMTIDKAEVEKWEYQSIFTRPEVDARVYRMLVHTKCFAMVLVSTHLMDERLIRFINLYSISSLTTAGCLMLAFSPILMWKVIPIIFFTIGLIIHYFITSTTTRYGFFFIYCIICCMEVHGFEFIFDLYVVTCFVIETAHSLFLKKVFKTYVPLIVLSECAIWSLSLDMVYKVLINFVWLVVQSIHVEKIRAILTVYFISVGVVLVGLIEGFDVEEKLDHIYIENAVIIKKAIHARNAGWAWKLANTFEEDLKFVRIHEKLRKLGEQLDAVLESWWYHHVSLPHDWKAQDAIVHNQEPTHSSSNRGCQ